MALLPVSVLLGCSVPETQPACDAPVVLAASDLRLALPEIATLEAAVTGCDPVIAYGSTGQFTAQLRQGAPADLFLAADASFVDLLLAEGLVDPDSVRVYAEGRLSMLSAPGLLPPIDISELGASRFSRIAIANPEHAPYGRAAVEALKAAGVYDAVEDRLVYGENVAATAALVRSGNAAIGLIARALTDEGVPVDPRLYAPLRQVAVVPRSARHPAAGLAFLDRITGPDGEAVLARYGLRPGHAPKPQATR